MESFTMKDVLDVLERDFSQENFKKAKESIEESGKDLTEVERIRLWMAIINLSEKNIQKIKYWVTESKIDTQKVLFLGE